MVQCDRLNRKIDNTIVAVVTGNTRRAGVEPSQFLIDPGTTDGASSGLAMPSAVKCENLVTIQQRDVLDVVGHLSDPHKLQLQDRLKAALELP